MRKADLVKTDFPKCYTSSSMGCILTKTCSEWQIAAGSTRLHQAAWSNNNVGVILRRGTSLVKLSPGSLLFARSLASQHGFWELIVGQSAAYIASLRRQTRKCLGTSNNHIAPNKCTTLYPCTVTLCRENAPRLCFLLTSRNNPYKDLRWANESSPLNSFRGAFGDGRSADYTLLTSRENFYGCHTKGHKNEKTNEKKKEKNAGKGHGCGALSSLIKNKLMNFTANGSISAWHGKISDWHW